MPKLTSKEAHRCAGLSTNFLWQDQAATGHVDPSEVEYTSLIGELPQEVNGSPVFVIHVDGIADSGFGYTYPVEEDVTVKLQDTGEPIVCIATEEDVAQAEQHNKDKACKEYAELMRLVSIGAYDERDEEGDYGKDGVEKRIAAMEHAALGLGLQFVVQPDKKTYKLDPATVEMLDAYDIANEEDGE